jgi:hypothetical protein
MLTYKHTPYDVILRSDGVCFPAERGDRYYEEYLKWVAAGNTATPADSPPVSDTNAPIIAKITALEATQARPIREFSLGIVESKARIQSIEAKIAELRKTLT